MGEQPVIVDNADAARIARVVTEGIDLIRIAAEIARPPILAPPSVLHRRWHGEALDAILGDRTLLCDTLRPTDAAVPVHTKRALSLEGVVI